MKVSVYKPLIDQSDIDAVSSVLLEAWLGQGKHVKTFEDKIKLFLGNPDRKVVAVSNGTSAAHLSLLAAGVKPGDIILWLVNHGFVSRRYKRVQQKSIIYGFYRFHNCVPL